MNKTLKICLIVAGLLIASPFILKGIVFTMGTIMAALIIAGVFLLGVCVTLAITSPLWIPFLAGWVAVKYCRSIKKEKQ
jgi:membrane protein implicated in regulation of membrane protease activity